MIKELLKEGNKRYFLVEGQQGNILFSIYEWDWNNQKTLEEIETGFLNADIPSYLKDRYTLEQLLNEPVAIFELEIINNNYQKVSYLKPMNMSLWEYETLVKNNKEVPKALKMAFISQEEDSFYIACESYDSDSMVTSKNMNTVNKWLSNLTKELEKVLNKCYGHVEAYY